MMSRKIMKPTVQGTKVNYYLSFDMYPSEEEDDIVIPDEPTEPDVPSDDDDESGDLVYDGGQI